MPFDAIDAWDAKLTKLEVEVEEIMKEEKEERAMSQADMELRKGENLVVHEAEILARPKRTWFESEDQKKAARDAGSKQLNGEPGAGAKGEKKKLSNKEKKKLDASRERTEGMGWKKGKAERAGKGALEAKKTGKKGGGGKPDGRKPDGKKAGSGQPDGRKAGAAKPDGMKAGSGQPDGRKPAGGGKPDGRKPDGRKAGSGQPDGRKAGGGGGKPDGKKMVVGKGRK